MVLIHASATGQRLKVPYHPPTKCIRKFMVVVTVIVMVTAKVIETPYSFVIVLFRLCAFNMVLRALSGRGRRRQRQRKIEEKPSWV